MTTQETFPSINLDVIRATLLDDCGIPAWGDEVYITSDGVVSVAVTANYDTGTDLSLKNGRGLFCVRRPAEEQLLDLSLTVAFCKVNPLFYTALTGFPPIVNAAGIVVGYAIDRSVRPVDVHVALEGWADAYDESGCVAGDPSLPFNYNLWPHLRGGMVADYTLENNVVTFTVNGMRTRDPGDWGLGPYLVADDETGAAQALYDAVSSSQHQVSFKTLIAPPAGTDALLPLDDPDTADATTATAGTPGTFNGVRPATLAALQASSITGSGGVTPWTTGRYVILGDGSFAHWAGSGATPKWVAGKAT
jgi:hypothetical protein